jgi:hypothetical protein
MKVFGLLMTCALVSGCASTMQARSDYDSSQDFSGYRLFAWMDADPLIAPVGTTSQISPLNRRRIVEAIEGQLGANWHWGRTYFGDEVDVDTYREGTLAIDVFDGKSHQPVWHGWATKRITEADIRGAAEQIPIAVTAILESFPPR